MSVGIVMGIGALGGLGALARFALDGAVSERLGRAFPYGTLAVNLSGALVLGVLVGATVTPDALRLAGTGFVGAFTTFSTWMLETHRLGEDGEAASAVGNVVASLVLGIAVAALGRRLGAAL